MLLKLVFWSICCFTFTFVVVVWPDCIRWSGLRNWFGEGFCRGVRRWPLQKDPVAQVARPRRPRFSESASSAAAPPPERKGALTMTWMKPARKSLRGSHPRGRWIGRGCARSKTPGGHWSLSLFRSEDRTSSWAAVEEGQKPPRSINQRAGDEFFNSPPSRHPVTMWRASILMGNPV